MKIFICRTCNRKMIPNPGHKQFQWVLKNGKLDGYLCTIPDCSSKYTTLVPWFLDYEEYTKKETLAAWQK